MDFETNTTYVHYGVPHLGPDGKSGYHEVPNVPGRGRANCHTDIMLRRPQISLYSFLGFYGASCG